MPEDRHVTSAPSSRTILVDAIARRYVHADMSDLAAAVQALEPLPGTTQGRMAIDAPMAAGNQMVAGLVAASIDNDRESLRSIENNRPFPQASP